MLLLRDGALSRAGSELPTILQSLPTNFPLALIPEGGVPTVAAVSSSMTVVVAIVKADCAFSVIDFRSKLEQVGWMNNGFMGGGFDRVSPLVTVCRADEFASF